MYIYIHIYIYIYIYICICICIYIPLYIYIMNPLIFKRIHIGLGYNRSLLFSFYNISSQVDMLFRNSKLFLV